MSKPPPADLVSVACKLPNGLNIGNGIILLGTAHERGSGGSPPETYGGYRITDNVPRAPWDEWLRTNARSPMVVNGIVFAADRRADAVARARSSKSTRHGFEPMGGGQRRTK